MIHKKMLTLLLIGVLVAFTGCSQDESPVGLLADSPAGIFPGLTPGKDFSPQTINNFQIEFMGRTLAGGNTTFSWRVSGTGVEPALSHFMVQLPECAPEPIAYTPSNSVSINANPNTGIYGVEWHLNVEADDSLGRTYYLTFPGNVPLGEVYSSVISGNETGVGIIPGPCQGFDIAGRVFVDANENGQRDPDEESGINNVVVELIDAQGFVQTVVTNQSGDYTFRRLAGSFTVNIPLEGYPGYFNSSLLESFDPTTILNLEATVPLDAYGNDFGFSPQSEEIIQDLETGVLLSDGRSLKFWKSEFRSAAGNGNGNHIYDAATLSGFLAEIQGLFLDDPYSFTPGSEIQEAFQILRSNSQDPVDELLAELLATELNQVSGRGLVGQADLQLVLIAWGEAIVAEFQTVEVGKLGDGLDKAPVRFPEVEEATQLFGLVNTGGGGGIDE